jgi:hypothetical protein
LQLKQAGVDMANENAEKRFCGRNKPKVCEFS